MKSGISLLGMGIAPRLVMAAALVVVIWLMVMWALA